MAAGSAQKAAADEGMWTFDNFPAARVRAAYGWSPDQAWLDRVQKASVRLDNGCSGSVVSRNGLVLTNHHCVIDCVADLSTARQDYVGPGFLAAERREERVCPGLEVSILQSIVDVTARVRNAAGNLTGLAAAEARETATSTIEQESCGEDRAKRCEVVSLYRGGQFKLYTYDRYQDVRLVFAPELQAANFGGDPDNFNFPRFAFDMGLLRLYRDGRPASFANPLQIDPAGAEANELVFISGHPGSTQRLLTVAELEFLRDQYLPWRVEYFAMLRGSLITESTKGEEEARQSLDALLNVENSLKAFRGQRGALVEPAFFATKVAEERRLRDALAANPQLRQRFGDPFAEAARAVQAGNAYWRPYQMLEVRFGAGSQLLSDARSLVRAAAERARPEAQRLGEYTAANLPSLEQAIGAESPVSPFLEELEIEFWLSRTRELLGADHPAVKAMFGAQSALEIAHEIATSSQLASPAVRMRLFRDPAQVQASNDPAIALARRVDSFAREARSDWGVTSAAPLAAASEQIANLRFEVLGDATYPDATFTLRLSYGQVKGWNDPAAGQVAPFTRISGLFDRATGAAPFDLPARWAAARSRLRMDTQENLVTTNDIIGGNSGSPLLDRQGRIVGLVFDGNIHSLGGAFGFDPQLNRTVAVSSPLIIEGLRTVYGANAIADELVSR
jgi:hypothetical protein